jgi:hypothetical protein
VATVEIGVFLPLSAPVRTELPGESVWEACQELVGGSIEVIPLGGVPAGRDDGWRLAAYVNEDGIARGMPLNRAMAGNHLYGPVCVVRERVDGDGGTHYASLTPRDWRYLLSIDRMAIPLPLGVDSL